MVFSNKFNSKKADPLVEAAKAAMELGQKRREAINAVNEEFGVFNRNAVVREHLAAYDARIEEVYKGMMAGNLTEGKKLADKDYDKDGKIESPKDEVWGSRFRAAKAAGKMEEGSQWRKPGREGKTWGTDSSEDREDGHETKFQLNKKGKISDGPNKDVLAHRKDPDKWYSKAQQKKHGVDLKSQIKNQIGKHTKPNLPEEIDYSAPDRAAVTKDNKPVVSTTAPKADTSGPSAADKAGLAAKIGAMREAKLDEVSKKLAIKAYKKSQDNLDNGQVSDYHWAGKTSDRLRKHLERKQGKNEKPGRGEGRSRIKGNDGHSGRSEYSTPTKSGKYNKTTQKSWAKQTSAKIERERGRPKPHLPEEHLDEAVSRKHFQQVADLIKGHESQEKRNELATHHAGIFAKQNPRFDHGRFHKAAGSTAHEAPKKMEEAAYSAKAGRAGKDLGKPDKMFSKIAKKAGKEYGSEEKGKKVAGAILAKIRAKHMKEEQSF